MTTLQHFDLDTALDYLGGDREFLRDLGRELLVQVPKVLADLPGDIARRDGESLHVHAHSLKGALGVFAATEAAARARALESRALEEDFEGAEEALQRLRDELDALIPELKQELHL